MKSGELHPKEGVWNWERADKIADFCRKNGIKLRGHCLVWHAQFCDWMMNDEKGNPCPRKCSTLACVTTSTQWLTDIKM